MKKHLYSVSAPEWGSKLIWATSIYQVERKIGATRNILEIKKLR